MNKEQMSYGQFSASSTRFMEFGRNNAQFAGVGIVVLGVLISGVSYVGQIKNELNTQQKVFETKIAADKETLEAKIAAARSDAIKETSDKFLMYGYAAEYQRLQDKTQPKKDT
jgi:hypothetical protein